MSATLSLFLIGLRERVREARSFLRFPLRLSLVAPGRDAACVLLYGVPYADWNAPLSNDSLWAGVTGVASVIRLPALPILSNLIARLLRRSGLRQIVIPTKTGHTKHLPYGWRALCPDETSVNVLGDKRRFASYMAANGFGDHCPATFSGIDEAVYPCVLKRSDLSASWGIVVVHSRDELEGRLRDPLFKGHPVTLQALVAGSTEHATYCVCKDGAILWHCTFLTEVAQADTIKSEDSVLRRWKIATPEPIVRRIEAVLAPLAYSGPCNLDYKLGDDGKIRVFEINPRLGGSLMMPQYGEELRQALACIVANAA